MQPGLMTCVVLRESLVSSGLTALSSRPVSQLLEMLVKVVVTLRTGRCLVVPNRTLVSGISSMQLTLSVTPSTMLVKMAIGASNRCGATNSSPCSVVRTRFERLVTLTLTSVMSIALSGVNLMKPWISLPTTWRRFLSESRPMVPIALVAPGRIIDNLVRSVS